MCERGPCTHCNKNGSLLTTICKVKPSPRLWLPSAGCFSSLRHICDPWPDTSIFYLPQTLATFAPPLPALDPWATGNNHPELDYRRLHGKFRGYSEPCLGNLPLDAPSSLFNCDCKNVFRMEPCRQNCGGPGKWVLSTLAEGQRGQTCSCSFKDKDAWPKVWLQAGLPRQKDVLRCEGEITCLLFVSW